MAVRIRLQRHGKKGKPFYWIVAADSRVKRDGKFLEKLGVYDPNTNPATVEVNVDQAVKWLFNGAQPSDTARTLLSYRGVMLKKHLLEGVSKGALTEEQVEERFEAWVKEKNTNIQAKADGLSTDAAKIKADRQEVEKTMSADRAEARKPQPEEVAEVAEAPAVEATEEAPAADAAEKTEE
jgi:small subunit ribosomal protein S16